MRRLAALGQALHAPPQRLLLLLVARRPAARGARGVLVAVAPRRGVLVQRVAHGEQRHLAVGGLEEHVLAARGVREGREVRAPVQAVGRDGAAGGRREQGGMILRLLVDTPEGITVAECESLNNYLSEALDKEEVISEHFIIEVASPGLDRPMGSDRDFARVMGKDLEVRMYEPIEGSREHQGKLIGMDKENIIIESSGISIVIPRLKIAKAVLKLEF